MEYLPFLRPDPERQARGARRRLPVIVTSATLLVVLLAIPVALAVDSFPGPVADQHETDAPTFDDERLAAFRAHATQPRPDGAPTILSYHDIRPDPGPEDVYTVTPEEFASQMAMLDRAGFEVLEPSTFGAWLRGEATVPERSVVLTFDDGTKGLWTHADPILARHGFSAVVFVISSYVGEHQPYYLNWEELDRMVESGRWSAEAHTHEGHVRIPVDDGGGTAPFLLNRAWRDGTRESFGHWQARVEADLRANARVLRERGFGSPELFAYPFSSVISPTNDRRIPDRLRDLVNERFAFGVVNDGSAGPVRARDVSLAHLPRLELFRTTTTQQLFDRLSADEAIEPGAAEPFEEQERWFRLDTSRVPAGWFGPNRLAPEVPVGELGWYAFAPGQSAAWQRYRAGVTVSQLGDRDRFGSAALQVLSGSDAAIRVSASPSQLRVALGRSAEVVLHQESLALADEHRIEVEVRGFEIVVIVDGVERWRGEVPDPDLGEPAGGVALAAWRASDTDPQPAFSDLTVVPLDARGAASP